MIVKEIKETLNIGNSHYCADVAVTAVARRVFLIFLSVADLAIGVR